MQNVRPKRNSYPCTVTDAIADGMLEVGVDMVTRFCLAFILDILTDVVVGVNARTLSDDDDIVKTAMDNPMIILELLTDIACTGDVSTDMLTFLVTDVVPAINVAMLGDENTNGLAVTITPLEFS